MHYIKREKSKSKQHGLKTWVAFRSNNTIEKIIQKNIWFIFTQTLKKRKNENNLLDLAT